MTQRTNVMDKVWFSQNEPNNKYQLWLSYSRMQSQEDPDEKMLVMKAYDNGKWSTIGGQGGREYIGGTGITIDGDTISLDIPQDDNLVLSSFSQHAAWIGAGNGIDMSGGRIDVCVGYNKIKDPLLCNQAVIEMSKNNDLGIVLKHLNSDVGFIIAKPYIVHDINFEMPLDYTISLTEKDLQNIQPTFMIFGNVNGLTFNQRIPVINMPSVITAGSSYLVTIQFGVIKFELIETA